MGFTFTPVNRYKVPDADEGVNIPGHLADLFDFEDQGSPVRRMTQAQIDALPWAQKPNGWLCFNQTSGRLQVSDGAELSNVNGITIGDDGSVSVTSLALAPGGLVLSYDGSTWCRVASPSKGLRVSAGTSELRIPQDGAALLTRATALGDAAGALVTKGFVDGWSDWAPVLRQGSVVAAAVTRARFNRVGRTVTAYGTLAVSGAGIAGQAITVDLPVAPVAANAGGGSFSHFDVGVAVWAGAATVTASGLSFFANGANVAHGIAQGTLSAGDSLSFTVTYETA